MRRRIGAFLTIGILALSQARVYSQQQPAMEPLPPMTPMAPMAPMLPITPSTQPSDAVSERYRPLTGTSSTALPLLPYDYTNPTVDGASPSATTQPVFVPHEGTYLNRRAGRFARSADGKSWQFTPDPTMANAVSMPTLTVLPSLALAAMEEATKDAKEARFSVSGTVTMYNAQPYLVVDLVTTADAPATLAAEKVEPAPAPAPATPAPKPTAPDQMLNQMLRPGGATAAASTARPLQPTTNPGKDLTTGAGAVAPGAPTLSVIREGTFLVDRTGRLVRSADGQSYEFAFESDGRAMKDPPVVILPNLKLMAMEQASKGSNRDLRFRITGMVTEYNGRNYVLLEKVVVVPEVTQQF